MYCTTPGCVRAAVPCSVAATLGSGTVIPGCIALLHPCPTSCVANMLKHASDGWRHALPGCMGLQPAVMAAQVLRLPEPYALAKHDLYLFTEKENLSNKNEDIIKPVSSSQLQVLAKCFVHPATQDLSLCGMSQMRLHCSRDGLNTCVR